MESETSREGREALINLEDLAALIKAREKQARLETERLVELREIRSMLQIVKKAVDQMCLSGGRVEATVGIVAQYLAAQTRNDRQTMHKLARQAKEINIDVEQRAGGIHIEDVGRDVIGVAGRDVYMDRATELIRGSTLPLPHKAELAQDMETLQQELEKDEPDSDVLDRIMLSAERVLPTLVPIIAELIRSSVK